MIRYMSQYNFDDILNYLVKRSLFGTDSLNVKIQTTSKILFKLQFQNVIVVFSS